jgi:hypothetical protein
VTRVAISIQTLSGRKDRYLRKEVGTMHKRTILEAVEEMLDDQAGHTIGKLKPTFKGHKPAYKPDQEVLPDAAVDVTVEAAFT